MATKDITPRTIALSAETAGLLDAKKALDGLFDKVGEVAGRMFGPESSYDDRLNAAYAGLNGVIMGLMAEQIDSESTESLYKVI